jgi:hypothetical protein
VGSMATAGADDVRREACRKVRSGVGSGWACTTHGVPWPCRVRAQAYEQLTLLAQTSALGVPVLLEIAAERLHQLSTYSTDVDDTRGAHQWIELVVEYLNRATIEGRLLAEREAEHAPLDTTQWRRRLLQVSAIAAAAVEWCDRVTPPPASS